LRVKAKLLALFLLTLISIGLLVTAFDYLNFVSSSVVVEVQSLVAVMDNETKISVESDLFGVDETPLFMVLGRTETPYLRDFVGDFYEGGVWFKRTHRVVQYVGGPVDSNVSNVERHRVDFEVQPLTDFGGFIPSTQNPLYILIDHPLLYYVDQQVFYSEHTFKTPYKISYNRYVFSLETLKKAAVPQEPNYLDVTPELLKKLKPLALSLTSDLNSPFEKLIAIEDYLRNNYEYDYNYTRAPAEIDPVEWFLFYSKRGVCTHFNSAFVLLARSIGIPARLVGGYLISPSAENQVVKAKQKHAYAETLLESVGWIIFDATAPRNFYTGGAEPTLEILYPTEGAYVSGLEINVVGRATGFYGGRAGLSINHTGFTLAYWKGDFNFVNSSYIEDGDLAITVSASDSGGNEASDSVKFTVDNTLPRVLIAFPLNGTSLNTPTLWINGTVMELNKGGSTPFLNDTRFTLAFWNPSTGAFSYTNQTAVSGNVSVRVSFSDLAGNRGWVVVSFTVVEPSASTSEGFAADLTPPQSGSINVLRTSSHMLLFLAALSIPTIIISAIVWRTRKRAPRGKVAPFSRRVTQLSTEEKPRLSISFPQIRNPLPLVWGVGEPLVVRVSVFDSSSLLPSATVRVNVEGVGEDQLMMRNDGFFEATYIFNKKGAFKIQASFDKEVRSEEVRIVDYREEVVRLFNSFYDSAKEKFSGLFDWMTPRETQSVIMSQVAPAKHKPLEIVTRMFEVANYSLHPIGRREYEEIYLSMLEFWG
jgi:transglutaminase-like putative cysteine protease